jgi:hypothetical protein
MAEDRSIPAKRIDSLNHSPGNYGVHAKRTGENRLIWEMPLGTKRGYLDEPGPRFVDVEGEAELEAMRWERGLSTIDSQRAMAGKVDPARKMPGAA